MKALVMAVALLVIEIRASTLEIEALSDKDRKIFLKVMPRESWVLNWKSIALNYILYYLNTFWHCKLLIYKSFKGTRYDHASEVWAPDSSPFKTIICVRIYATHPSIPEGLNGDSSGYCFVLLRTERHLDCGWCRRWIDGFWG
jgi:hypothetical protein